MSERSIDCGWSESLPRGFYSLMKTLPHKYGSVECVVAVVADEILPPKKSNKGSDHFMTAKLKDPSIFTPQPILQNRDYVKCRWFQHNGDQLPGIQNVGDIVLIRKPDVTLSHRGAIYEIVLSCKSTNHDTIVFPVESIDAPRYGPNAQRPTSAEQLLVTRLARWSKENLGVHGVTTIVPAPAKVPQQPQSVHPPNPHQVGGILRPTHKKFSLLEKVVDGKFYVVFGEVVKFFKADGQNTTIYITDYTTNNLFFDYKDMATNSGGFSAWDSENNAGDFPKGRMTIQVTLWPPHSDFANLNVKKGDIVRLNNMNVKYKEMYLEGKCHGDTKYPDKIDISIVSEKDSTFGELPGLLARREKYRAALLAPPANKTKAKNKKRKEEKRLKSEKERLAKENEQNRTAGANGTDLGGVTIEDSNGLNKKIVTAANRNLPPLSLHAIINSPHRQTTLADGSTLNLPFINMTALAHVRVVGFKPDKLEDFAHSLDDQEYADLSDNDDEDSMDLDEAPKSRWEWAFWLLLEDKSTTPGEEPTQMPVLVHGQNAVYLLKLDASDLRTDVYTFHELKQKLRELWGDQEEIKSEGALRAPTAKAFACCIQEYGVQVDGSWMRMHRLCKTTIQ